MKELRKLIVTFVLAIAIVAPSVFLLEANTITVHAASVQLNKKKVTLKNGESSTLVLKNNKKKIKWSSSNSRIAKVSKSGKVVAKAAGTAKISAKVGKKKYTCTVKVNFKDVTLTAGKTTTLKVTGVSASKVKWSSSNTSVATVSKGKVTTKSAGTAIITAKVGKTSYKAKLTVQVQQPEWKSYFRVDYIIDTADGVLMKATNISSKTINDVYGYVDYKDSLGYKISDDLDCVNGIAPNQSFYMTFDHPYNKSYSSWVYSFKVNTTSLTYTSRISSLSLVAPWFDINKWYWKSGATVRNSSARDLTFDIVAIYKYQGKIVGFGVSVWENIEAGSAKDISVEGSCAAEYDSVEHVLTNCATYN